MMRTGLLILIGAGGGVLVAAGVVALLVGLGIITRFAGISRTAVHTKLYESMILLGAVYGNMFTVYGMTIFKGRLVRGRRDHGAGGGDQHFPDRGTAHRACEGDQCHRDLSGAWQDDRKSIIFLYGVVAWQIS